MSPTTSTVNRLNVLADVVPGDRLRDLLVILSGTALTAICAQISVHVPPSPVPITGQTFAVVVAGAALGGTRGSASQLLYVLVGLAFPVYADGAHGWHILSGPTGGYIIAFPIAAYVIGRLAEYGSDRHFTRAFGAYVLGQLVIFGIGVPWLMASAALSWATAIHEGFTIFIVGGLVKAAAAGILTPVAWRAVHRMGR